MKFCLVILQVCLLFGCIQYDDKFSDVYGKKIIYPELPLFFIGNTIPEPEWNDFRFISMIDGNCWTCLTNYSVLKEVVILFILVVFMIFI